MVLFNYSTKELTAKIVYYGPGLCGKTTNLQFIYDNLAADKRGRMLSLSTQTDRTLYFDFLPVELGDIRGMKTRVQLYTVPGQVFYNETRKMVLKGVDGIVFVADSQIQMADANLESYRNLEENIKEHGADLARIPLVLQFNKRDLPSIQTIEEMNAALNRYNSPFYEVIATTGIGVQDTLKAISKLVLLSLSGQYGQQKGGNKEAARRPRSPQVPAPETPPARAVSLPVSSDSGEPFPAADLSPRAASSQPSAATAAPIGWNEGDLEEELDRMDAEEIQGLLEEVDGFDGDDSVRVPVAAAMDPPPEKREDVLLDTPRTDPSTGRGAEATFASVEPSIRTPQPEPTFFPDLPSTDLDPDDVSGAFEEMVDAPDDSPGAVQESPLTAAGTGEGPEDAGRAGAGPDGTPSTASSDLPSTLESPFFNPDAAGAAVGHQEKTEAFSLESFLADQQSRQGVTRALAAETDLEALPAHQGPATGLAGPTLLESRPSSGEGHVATLRAGKQIQVPLCIETDGKSIRCTLTMRLDPSPPDHPDARE